MNCICNYQDYLNRKSSGENVISKAALYGFQASRFTSDDFLVIVLSLDNVSFYRYHVDNRKFFVTDYKEALPHQISNFISLETIHDTAIKKWWDNIFFEREGLCTYDTYYDGLTISEDSDITFKDIIKNIVDVVSTINIPTDGSYVFLTGDLSTCPLIRYAFQQNLPSSIVNVLPSPTCEESVCEKDIVIYPEEQLENLVLYANGGIKFSMLAISPVSITLPLLSVRDMMMSETNWDSMLDNQRADYSVGNFDFKKVNVQVECDVFQNIFLICDDLDGNRKVKHIN